MIQGEGFSRHTFCILTFELKSNILIKYSIRMNRIKATLTVISCFFALSVYAQDRPKKLLAIFAHPDDEQSIGPLLVKSVEEGVEVTLVLLQTVVWV